MAKRFMDTKLHKKAWFRRLRSPLREAFRVLCSECDEIGVWDIDLDVLNFMLNVEGDERVTLEELQTAFGFRIIEEDKLLIPGFVSFQYGDESGWVSPKNKLFPKIKRMLLARGLPLPTSKGDGKKIDPPSMGDTSVVRSPIDGVKEEEKEKEEDKEEEKEKEEEAFTPPEEPKQSGIPPDVRAEWKTTLEKFSKVPNWLRDEPVIYRTYQRVQDWQRVRNALAGFRYEQKSAGYDPARHVYLRRLEDPKKFEYLENLGETKPELPQDPKDPMAELRRKYA